MLKVEHVSYRYPNGERVCCRMCAARWRMGS